MGAPPPQEEQKLTGVSFWKPLWSPLHPKTQEVTKIAKFHDFHDFPEIQRVLQKITLFAKMSTWRRGAPPEVDLASELEQLLSVARGRGAAFARKVEKT